MTRYIRMKRIFLQGLIWLYLLGFGFMAMSLEPGFLDFDNLPDTNFSCVGKVIGGYYADLETNCQMFHVCTIGQLDEPMDIRFLCLNGTVFDQETRVCERIDEVDCSKSEQFYSLNLELYGNTQPAILEESPETEQPLIIKSTTTTTTTTQAPRQKTSRTPFYTTVTSPTVTTANNPQVISTHHFPVGNSPDIRFNPEEINISLHPGAPPDIRTKPVTFHQQSYSDNNKKVVVTTHSENSDNKKVTVTTHSAVFDEGQVPPHQEQGLIERPQIKVSSTQKPHVHSYSHIHGNSNKKFNHPTPSDINYEFGYHQTEPNQDYHTDLPQNYHYQSNFRPSQEYSGHHHNPHSQQFKSSTYQNEYVPTTSKIINSYQQKTPTTLRNYYLQSLKPPPTNQHRYAQSRSESPQRLQLPLPLLPTLSPLTFSSPAPFSLQHHIETKRYTKDHQAPPRIIISASASVSDASGRRLNYSLGTIGAAEILEQPPHSYDEYKDDDVGLDPFYHDVPKIKQHSRNKRAADAEIKHSDIIRNEQEAVDVLKFLFDWYKNNEKTATETTTIPTITLTDPISPELITQINDELTSFIPEGEINIGGASKEETDNNNFNNSDLFNRKSKYSIIGNKSNDVENEQNTDNSAEKVKVDVKTNRNIEPPTTLPHNSSGNSTSSKEFIDELFRHEEDYVNDNFEPVAYSELYGKDHQSYTKDKANNEHIKLLVKEEKRQSVENVDDNIKPIYFRPEIKDVDNTEKDISSKNKLHTDDMEDDAVTEHPTTEYLNKPGRTNEGTEELTDLSNKDGDTQTNNINKKEENNRENLSPAETTTTVTVTKNFSTEVAHNSEPKSEILEMVTTEKTTISKSRSRSDRRRGRRRFHKTVDKEKELDTKSVVLEKITEKAHTAKDDFNYLRTLYRVHTTTPMSSASNSKDTNERRNAIINVEQTKSAEDRQDTFDVQSIDTTSNEQLINITTEANVLLDNIIKDKVTTVEDIMPIATTEETITSTTTKSISPRRGERRRGRSRHNDDTNRKQLSRRNHHSRRRLTTAVPNELTSSQAPNNIEEIVDRQYFENNPTVHTNNISEVNSDTKNDNTIEKQGSNTSSSFVPYSEIKDITTEYTRIPSQPPNNIRGVDGNRFLSQLTINYKKLFQDITKSNDSIEVQDTSPPYYSTTEPQKLFQDITESNDSIQVPNTTPLFYPLTEPEVPNGADSLEKVKLIEVIMTAKPVQEEESEENSPNLTLASSDAVYVPHVETQKTLTTTTESNLEIIETQEAGSPPTNLSELYTEAIREGFIVTTSTNNILDSEIQSTLIQDIGDAGHIDNIEARKLPKFPLELPTEQVVLQETENYTTTSIDEVTTESAKYFETSKTETNQIVDRISTTQPTTENLVEETDYDKIAESILTTQLPTDKLLLLEQPQGNNNDYSDLTQKINSPEIEVDIKLGPEDVSSVTQTTTDRIITEGVNNLEDTKSKDQIPTTYTTTERLQKLIEAVEVATKSTVSITDLENKIEDGIINSEVTTIRNEYVSEIIDSSDKEEKAERVENLGLSEEIQNTRQSQINTTVRPELITANFEFTKQETAATEVATTLEMTTLQANDEITVVAETERLPSSSTEVITTTEQTVITTEQPVTTENTPITTIATTETTSLPRRGNRRGTRPARRRTTNNFSKSTTRHRFSTELFTRRPGRRRTTIEEQIVDELTKKSHESTTEPLRKTHRRVNHKLNNELIEEFATDAPLHKSVSPTQAEKIRESLPTTPFSNARKFYIFNCFGKEVDKFYPDPRDCRLFHYCTQGYNRNQLLDMKFVCDFNTYFDDDKLICTKKKPRRCL